MDSKERMGLKKFITEQLVKDDEFLRAISIDKKDFLNLSYPLPGIPDILENRLYSYKFFKDIKVEEESFMSYSISLKKSNNKIQTKSGTISFYIFTHINLMPTSYIYTRIDFIASKIDELFNRVKTKDIIKKIQFKDDDEISYNSSFVGYVVSYTFDSFNTSKVISYAN